MLTVAEVAKQLRMGRGKVLGFIHRRELAAVDVGTGKLQARWLVREEDLEMFIAGRRQGIEPPKARRKADSRVIEFIK
jgi:excisionase family DNA binding protein